MGKIPRENFVSGTRASDVADTNAAEVIAAAGAGISVDITDIILSNNDASVGTVVQVLLGSTVMMRVQVTTGAATTGNPVCINLRTPLKGTANTAWNVKCETNSAQVQATYSGYKVFDT